MKIKTTLWKDPVHTLKTWKPYYSEVASGCKKFELRFNDRDFKVGDVLLLREYDQDTQMYTGEECYSLITYILSEFDALQPGYVILSIDLIGD